MADSSCQWGTSPHKPSPGATVRYRSRHKLKIDKRKLNFLGVRNYLLIHYCDLHMYLLAGHAFEARIYAENVPKGFLPATGVLNHYRPVAVSSSGAVGYI